jgi:zinc protease
VIDLIDAIPGPNNIVFGQLSNGLRVWVYENFETQTVSVQGYVPGGSINETPEQAGLADLTATLLRRGTLKRDFNAINEAVEAVGASFGFDAGRHTLSFDAYSLVEDVDLVLDLLAESLILPAFPEDELAKTRSRILTRLDERKHSTRAQASLTFRKHLYPPGHPYRGSLLGEPETVRSLKRDDLVRFYEEKIDPRGGVLVVVGAIAAEEALARLEQALGDWRHPQARPDLSIPPRPVVSGKIEVDVTVRGKSQSDIILGWPGIAHNDPDYYPMLVCNSILGRFGLGGRLGRRIREELGLAYYTYSSFSVNRGAGSWRAGAGVAPGNVRQTIENMLTEIKRITSEPVTDEELADVQSNLSGSLPLRLETNAGIGSYLLNMAWYELGADYLIRYADRIRAVGKEDVLRVARTYLDPENYVLVTAGPPAEEA